LVGCYKDDISNKNIPFMTSKGVCKAFSIKNGIILSLKNKDREKEIVKEFEDQVEELKSTLLN